MKVSVTPGDSSRCTDNGLSAINNVKELTADLRRPHADQYEVALWEDRFTVRGCES